MLICLGRHRETGQWVRRDNLLALPMYEWERYIIDADSTEDAKAKAHRLREYHRRLRDSEVALVMGMIAKGRKEKNIAYAEYATGESIKPALRLHTLGLVNYNEKSGLIKLMPMAWNLVQHAKPKDKVLSVSDIADKLDKRFPKPRESTSQLYFRQSSKADNTHKAIIKEALLNKANQISAISWRSTNIKQIAG